MTFTRKGLGKKIQIENVAMNFVKHRIDQYIVGNTIGFFYVLLK